MTRTGRRVVGFAGLVAAGAWGALAGCNAIDGLGDVPDIAVADGGGDTSTGPTGDGGGGGDDTGQGMDAPSNPLDATTDVATSADATSDSPSAADATDAPAVVPDAPRPVSSLSTSTVTNHQPTLKWEASPTAGVSGATVDVCKTRACTSPTQTFVPTGTSLKVPTALSPGVFYWRVHPGALGEYPNVSSPTWELTVGAAPATATAVDTSWGTKLDFNGDGCADVAVGADYDFTTGPGHVFLYPGSISGLPATPTITLTGPSNGSYFGYSLSSAGDMNGDGYADLVVGAYGVTGAAGSVYVYLGGPTGLATTAAVTIGGPDGAGGSFGSSVASAGDLNGDGYADIVVGVPGAISFTGKAYVYFGGPEVGQAGFAPTPGLTLTNPSGATYSSFGRAVAGAGDVNGDGYGDIVVGAYQTASLTGGAYLYLGGPNVPADGGVAAPTALAGASANSTFGYSVAGAGDVNGDGYADVVVGGYYISTNTGEAYVYYGGASSPLGTFTLLHGLATETQFGESVASAGDVNGDGYTDVLIGAPLTGSSIGAVYLYPGTAAGVSTAPTTSPAGPDPTPPGAVAQGDFGQAVASAGNITCQTYPAIIVGAPSSGSTLSGEAFVFLGGTSGLSYNPTSNIAPPVDAGSFGHAVFGATN